MDFVFVLLIAGFTAAMLLMVVACDRLAGGS